MGAGGTADPCWGPAPAYTLAQCENTGVTAGQYGHIVTNPAAQINTQVGGNTGLQPETADTWTFGGVWQPDFVPGLSVSIDAFDIKVKDTITSLSSNTIIANCANSGDAALCGLIHRGPSGSLWLSTSNFVTATFINIGQVETSGIDLESNYHTTMGHMGRLSLNLTGTYTNKFETQPLPTGGSYDCAGTGRDLRCPAAHVASCAECDLGYALGGSGPDAALALHRHLVGGSFEVPTRRWLLRTTRTRRTSRPTTTWTFRRRCRLATCLKVASV